MVGIHVNHGNTAYPMLTDGDLVITYKIGDVDDGDAIVYCAGGQVKPSEIKFVNEAIRSDEQNALVATGETASVFFPYAIAMFLTGGIVLFLALRRRKEDTYE
ncbi:MAG: LPXTG cell wall anchor domain-containing protein [Saccharofermentans sp.]|nr:LPXTG cell wall anchor domain-containing protein [Saccharofermentans sp.]